MENRKTHKIPQTACGGEGAGEVGLATAAAEVHRVLMLVAIARLSALAGGARCCGCLALPSPVFEELCGRMLDRRLTVESAVEWLRAQGVKVPSRSAVHRFACILYREFRQACQDYAGGKVAT